MPPLPPPNRLSMSHWNMGPPTKSIVVDVSQPFGWKRKQGDSLIITSVIEGKQAEKVGIKIGWQIVAVDGVGVSSAVEFDSEIKEAKNSNKDPKTVSITFTALQDAGAGKGGSGSGPLQKRVSFGAESIQGGDEEEGEAGEEKAMEKVETEGEAKSDEPDEQEGGVPDGNGDTKKNNGEEKVEEAESEAREEGKQAAEGDKAAADEGASKEGKAAAATEDTSPPLSETGDSSKETLDGAADGDDDITRRTSLAKKMDLDLDADSDDEA